ncbi:MAG: hypothetical protein JHC95_06835 [Solirubrobacteraceae bacterium]|nr:hypothetical protein [Solirubrobacteraceae bacterium]
MATLSARDLRAVLDLVGEVHHAETLEQFRSALLPAIKALIPCDWISYNEIGAEGEIFSAIMDPQPAAHLFAEWDRYALQNPILEYYQRTRDGRAYRISDFVTRRQFHALELYQHVYGPMRVEHQIAMSLPSPPEITIGIALSRYRPDFTQRDREILDISRPHLIQAWRNAQRHGAAPRNGSSPRPAAGDLATRESLMALGLTVREADVLQALMAGASTQEVAVHLEISPRTVHKHGERIRTKLGVRTRTEAVARAWASLDGYRQPE